MGHIKSEILPALDHWEGELRPYMSEKDPLFKRIDDLRKRVILRKQFCHKVKLALTYKAKGPPIKLSLDSQTPNLNLERLLSS